MNPDRPIGITLLSAFFAFGACMAGLACLTLLLPDTRLSGLWALNPDAHARLEAIGSWSIALMAVVSLACASAAFGLWRGDDWGRAIALGVLGVNLVGDATNALLRHDLRTLIGIPIGAALIAYLLSKGARSYFHGDGD